MKLLAQNLISCKNKNCTVEACGDEPNYPLDVIIKEVLEVETAKTSIMPVIERVNWEALKTTMERIEHEEYKYEIPEEKPTELTEEVEETLRAVLLGKEIHFGELICRRCNREFRIRHGIVNMLPTEEEIVSR